MAEYVGVAFDLPINRLFTYRNPPGMDARIGCRVEAVFGRRTLAGWVTEHYEQCPIDPASVKEYSSIVDANPLFGADSLELARWISGMYFCPLGEALSAMMPSGRKEGRSASVSAATATEAFDNLVIGEKALQLSEEQQRARDAICAHTSGRWYLYGPTGTGKTEVFLQAAEATLAEGRGVIYLVPEIALTHQVLKALVRRFGDACAVIHSGLSPAKKLAQWRRVQSGQARVVVGARSAVFAPVRDLGLIVVDEEHESSYKAGSSPRYHARQVAMRLAAASGARLVMGSATPSVESWHLMAQGQLQRLSLTKRLAGGDMPAISIVDMRGQEGALSSSLVDAVRRVKAEGGQSILFLNRRGFSHFWSCRSCGAEASCRQCSVGLTYHKDRNRLVCHYCGYSAPPPGAEYPQ